jgi:hypothetical protein
VEDEIILLFTWHEYQTYDAFMTHVWESARLMKALDHGSHP